MEDQRSEKKKKVERKNKSERKIKRESQERSSDEEEVLAKKRARSKTADQESFDEGPKVAFAYVNQSTLNRKMANSCFSMYTKSNAVQTAVDRIFNYVFASGIQVTKEGKEVDLTPAFKTHLETYYIPFAQDALKWIMCTGVVPISSAKLEDENVLIPVVMLPGTGDVVFTIERGVKRFAWRYDNDIEVSKDVIVIGGFAADPEVNGDLTSKMSCLLDLEESCSVFWRCATRAEIYSSNPQYFLQMTSEAYKKNNGPNAQYSNFAEYDAVDDMERRRMYRVETQPSTGMTKMKLGENGPDTLLDSSIRNNQYVLPEDMMLVTGPQPKVRSDLIQMTDVKDKRICSVLGVPDFISSGKNRMGSRETESVNDTFKSTIQSWKQRLSLVMTRIYREIYGDEDISEILNAFDRENDITHYRTQDLVNFARSQQCTLHLPLAPFVMAQELRELWRDGVIDDAEFLRWARNGASLPHKTEVPEALVRRHKIEEKSLRVLASTPENAGYRYNDEYYQKKDFE